MKIILVCGPEQTGSTLLFNLLNFMLQVKYKTDSCWFEDYLNDDYNKDIDYLILKIHEYDNKMKNVSDYKFLTLRDFRDSLISRMRRLGYTSPKYKKSKRFNLNYFGENIEHNIKLFNLWLPHCDFIFKYEDYHDDSKKIIKIISNILDIPLTDNDIITIINKLTNLHTSKAIPIIDDKENHIYKKTLLSQNHNTSGGKIKKYLDFFTENMNNNIINLNNNIKTFYNKYYNNI